MIKYRFSAWGISVELGQNGFHRGLLQQALGRGIP